MKAILAALIKRTFTNENGGLIKLRDENDEWDWKAFWSIIIRLVLILAVGACSYYIGLL